MKDNKQNKLYQNGNGTEEFKTHSESAHKDKDDTGKLF